MIEENTTYNVNIEIKHPSKDAVGFIKALEPNLVTLATGFGITTFGFETMTHAMAFEKKANEVLGIGEVM